MGHIKTTIKRKFLRLIINNRMLDKIFSNKEWFKRAVLYEAHQIIKERALKN